ncbi:hypothetical protein KEM60_00284 [Austwickia sp. TVS 96-490-7B]|nr:hypothetical protein [Austwickia sp. TVS 96-490-7B]
MGILSGAVKAWLLTHPRVVLHYTATSPVLAGPRRTLVRRTDLSTCSSYVRYDLISSVMKVP